MASQVSQLVFHHEHCLPQGLCSICCDGTVSLKPACPLQTQTPPRKSLQSPASAQWDELAGLPGCSTVTPPCHGVGGPLPGFTQQFLRL